MKSINHFMALMFCLFVGTSMLLVAGICAADVTNYYYYSNQSNGPDNIMYRPLNLSGCTEATLSFSTRYNNEPGDFAIAFLSTDPKNKTKLIGWEYLNGTQLDWINKNKDLSGYIGAKWYVGFNYRTNGSGVGDGFCVDNILITVDDVIIFVDDGTNDSWELENFTRVSEIIQDATPPVVDNPSDIQIDLDATGSIRWVVTEEYPNKYWVLRNSTEVVPPGDYENNDELRLSINTSTLGIWNYSIFANDTSGNWTSDQVNITVVKKQIVNNNNNGGGGGGGGGGTSGEDFENIEVSETEREYVNKDSKVSYSFDMEGNIIRYINFTGQTSSGRIAAKIDTLKNTSTLVDHAPPGKVFMNMGIYVGNLGWASPNNIANPTISFIVNKSWVNENKIDKSSITLNRYSDGKWNPLETSLIDENQDHLYFQSKTPGFSQFAVTGTETSVDQNAGEEVVVKPTIVVERKGPITEQTPDEKDTGIPGFSLLTGFTIMLVVVQLLRRKQ